MEVQRLGQYVLMPADIESSFKHWWRSLEPSTIVDVRYPHTKHGNALKHSNSAKKTTLEEFLLFVNINSQPSGRSADSSGTFCRSKAWSKSILGVFKEVGCG